MIETPLENVSPFELEAERQAQAIAAFIAANTLILAPPFVSEVALHLARDSHEIFELSEHAFAGQAGRLPPYWAFAWPGGQALARYLLDHPDVVKSRRVVDIGSGSGIGAIAAAKAGASHVLAADIDPVAAVAIAMNAARNGMHERVTATTDDLLATLPDADLILISDLVYEPELQLRVGAFLERVAAAGIPVLLGDRLTAHRPASALTELASFDVALVPPLSDQEVRGARVWKLGRPAHMGRESSHTGGNNR